MDLGFLAYVGPEAEQVARTGEAVGAALGLCAGLRLSTVRPAVNCVVFLVTCSDVSEAESCLREPDSFFAYAGHVFSGEDPRHIPGAPFATPDFLLERLKPGLEAGRLPDHAAIDGQFAAIRLALESGKATRAELFTDRFGIHPCYWFQTPRGGLVVSNFAEAIASTGLHHGRLDGSALASFFAFGFTSFRECFLEGVRRLPAHAAASFDVLSRELSVRLGKDCFLVDGTDIGEEELGERFYWAVREAVRRRTRHLASPVELKLSGGYDSRFLLHCLIKDSVPFTALTESGPHYQPSDADYPRLLAERFGFPLRTEACEPYSIALERDDEIRGRGRVASSVRRHQMLGSFAVYALKGRHRKRYRNPLEDCALLPPSPLLARFPLEGQVRLRDRFASEFAGRDQKDKVQRWNLYNFYTAFMMQDEETFLSRPALDFRGTAHLPFCDERLFELSLRHYHKRIDARRMYDRLYERFMPEMLAVPMLTSQVAVSVGETAWRRMIAKDHAFRLGRLSEFMRWDAFRAALPPVPPETIPAEYFIAFYLFGVWLKVCAPDAELVLG